ncbi:orotidine-5'-phosphate decarboxylase [Helicobacter sp. MIT 99-5507]|uniref:orotidine-5'-phosphate decarboxylase n=1 Tax=Helicobacter sp. MIT 99-5507 TaxID=152489 RepID=UPI000E1EC9A1|nr:orotidine-5'-phosphate decarboxylase [Helicobacter sp. MIT 99-5507]RDU57355.1 orotidine-5'-phosphate decarboxylase [Helicobacter sp. MIT 99-5507]
MARLCIALDMESKNDNLKLCRDIANNDTSNIYLKVGLRSFIREGLGFIYELKKLGFRIFLDLKLYDIPNTMLDSIKEIIKLDIDMLTIHASAGRSALQSIGDLIKQDKNSPLVFAVSALTSFNEIDFNEIYNDNINNAILKFAKLSKECGISGIVCSPLESSIVKNSYDLLTLTPGIRPSSCDFDDIDSALYDSKDDQNRSTSIKMAIAHKSDFLVIGRPIYKNTNPSLLVKKILEIL